MLFAAYRKKIRSHKEKAKARIQSLRQELRRRCTDYVRTHRLHRRRRFNGRYTYTVVSAVFNVEKYLDDYFTSLTRQILDFKTHIHLILVDDGSTDGSAEVIKRWQRRYPKNITYLYKENGGQGSARNVGIPLVKTPWVTFIDPDDFVDVSYFWHVDNLLRKHHREDAPDEAIKLLSCNYYMYYEATGRYANSHPLRERFKKRESLKLIGYLGNTIQMNVNSVFFPTAELHASGLLFTESRWPSFEDSHFVLRYLLEQRAGHVLYARYPRYYYRKRADGSSSLDTAAGKPEYYLEQLREGPLALLMQARNEQKTIPEFLQYAALYHMSWCIRRGYCAPAPAILSAEDVEEFFRLCREIFSHIDERIILAFPSSLSGLRWWHKAGMLITFKGNIFPNFPVVIEGLDHKHEVVSLSYHHDSETDALQEKFYVDGTEIIPLEAKNIKKSLLGKTFSCRRLIYLPLPSDKKDPQVFLDGRPIPLPSVRGYLQVALGGKPVHLSLGGKSAWAYSGADIRKYFAPPLCPTASSPYSNSWVLMDRDTDADDNAEHLYRYIRANHPEQQIFFALRASSPHWERLKTDGFNLLDFGSKQHERVLRGCANIISSHADNYVMHDYPDMMQGKRFVFLQHGVTKDDISGWLNSKKIDLFITATHQEYKSIVDEGSPYNFTRREVKLTGFARHDALLANVGEGEKLLLIMPTWRAYLMGERLGKTNERKINEGFMDSRYARCWQSLLASSRLRHMTDVAGYSVMFFPHPNVQPYLERFRLASHITVYRNNEGKIQDIFRRARIFLTDYSSAAFDLALLRRAILYYQFDREELFSGTHVYRKGYYDYDCDGFGPVAFDKEGILSELEKLLRCDGSPDSVYQRRMEEAFSFRDGNNCKRIYQAVCALDE
jgi:glycosyltransferase involved in cell wall biosynthesis/CDP-glycerol glycerophosphotransferase (TagB/SpsB family)